MGPWVLPIIGLLTEALGLVRDERAKTHIDRVVKIQKEMLDEESLGYESDDAKIEYLEKQLIIEVGAVQNELALYKSKKPL